MKESYKRRIELFHKKDNEKFFGVFELYEIDPEDTESVKLILSFNSDRIESIEEKFFYAM